MWSRSPVCARPVRTLARSFLSASRLFFILLSAVFFTSAIMLWLLRDSTIQSDSNVHHRAFILSEHHALQRVRLEDTEHIDRKLLIAAQRERGRVHDFQVLDDRFIERELVVPHRVGMSVRVV